MDKVPTFMRIIVENPKTHVRVSRSSQRLGGRDRLPGASWLDWVELINSGFSKRPSLHEDHS